jgi:glycosyltransferase involved in cell wall biosynthesis
VPTVTVILPAYNASRFIGRAIESVLRQTWTDWQICLVDDGSTDLTRAIAESYASRLGSRLNYVYQPNRGLAAARNTAILNSVGEVFALLDADDVWLPHHLAEGMACLEARPGAGLVHADVARIDVDDCIIEFPPRPGAKYLDGRIDRHIYTRRAHILCPTVMFRRRALDVVGIFDESMRATEDRDLWFRIAERFEVAYLQTVHAHYRITPNSLSHNREVMITAQMLFLTKHLRRGAVTRVDFHQAFGNLLRERGDCEFKQGEFRAALGLYSRAVLQYPINGNNCYMLMRALGEPILGRIRSARAANGPS